MVWTLSNLSIEKDFGEKYFQTHKSPMTEHSEWVFHLSFLWPMEQGLGRRNPDFTQLASACTVRSPERNKWEAIKSIHWAVLLFFLLFSSVPLLPGPVTSSSCLLLLFLHFLPSMQLLCLRISSFPLSTAFFLFLFSSASPPFFLPPSLVHFPVPSPLSISSASPCFICYLLLCHLGRVK